MSAFSVALDHPMGALQKVFKFGAMKLRSAPLACGCTTQSESLMGPQRLCPVFRSAREQKLV